MGKSHPPPLLYPPATTKSRRRPTHGKHGKGKLKKRKNSKAQPGRWPLPVAARGSRRGKRPNVSEIRTGRPGYKQGAALHAAADL